MAQLSIAISPCPNDTFAFYSLIHNSTQDHHPYAVDFLDIEELNQALLAGKYDIAKGSFAIMEKIKGEYEILPVGAAIGNGVGPVLVGELKDAARIGLPGENTTAHQLFRFWQGFQAKREMAVVQMPFFKMIPSLKDKSIDAAVLIHEGRFVYPGLGLSLIRDLGAFWEEKTGAMIPLGCIYARKTLNPERKDAFARDLRLSIEKSRNQYGHKSAGYRNQILPYMREHAQEQVDAVVEAHVDTYVTSDTIELSPTALKSIDVFREKCLL